MDKNTVTGFILIFILVLVYGQLTKPTPEQLAEMRLQDSLEQVRQQEELAIEENPDLASNAITQNTPVFENDSLQQLQLSSSFGPFASSAAGTEKEEVLENELMKVTFTNKGGKIKEVLLKEYFKILTGEDNEETKGALKLLEDRKNQFEYLFPVANIPTGFISSEDLFFQPSINGNTINFKATLTNGQSFTQSYTLLPDSYQLDYDIRMDGFDNVISRDANAIQLNWVTYADKLEKNTTYERNYTTVYFKPGDDDLSYCSCTADGDEDADESPLKWISHSNQFFNTALMADNQNFLSGKMKTKLIDEEKDDLKLLQSAINIPFNRGASETFAMTMYLGPNEYDRLDAMGHDLKEIIPYGRSVFGTINRWIIRPTFNFLSKYMGSVGLVIFILTLVVKLVLYPLTYRMLHSQSKMSALKPRLSGLKEKFGDDQQAVQMETMKLYREFGVSPLGGCLPVVLQMPIWFALYRFFPASIEFRQASFLWATDLSSYDVFWNLPFEIPFYGAHVSLFTLLWAASTVAYTYYNTRHMDMSMNPMMKNMQYMMPVMFLFFFNNFAAGLTCYLLFSNVLNVIQTIVTKEYIIDKEKIAQELEDYRKKPKKKKKGGFQERLETALKEQQKLAAEKEAARRKKNKK